MQRYRPSEGGLGDSFPSLLPPFPKSQSLDQDKNLVFFAHAWMSYLSVLLMLTTILQYILLRACIHGMPRGRLLSAGDVLLYSRASFFLSLTLRKELLAVFLALVCR